MCGHNPTGCDPSMEEWKQIAEICKDRKLRPIFDTTFQGFVSGDWDEDAASLRYFHD
jgi:aspartate aminotransferase